MELPFLWFFCHSHVAVRSMIFIGRHLMTDSSEFLLVIVMPFYAYYPSSTFLSSPLPLLSLFRCSSKLTPRNLMFCKSSSCSSPSPFPTPFFNFNQLVSRRFNPPTIASHVVIIILLFSSSLRLDKFSIQRLTRKSVCFDLSPIDFANRWFCRFLTVW